jgi:hypothetical protein
MFYNVLYPIYVAKMLGICFIYDYHGLLTRYK